MTSMWAGSKVRLRGIEPEDWQAFMDIDENSDDMRSVDMIQPPRSAEGYRRWTMELATSQPQGDEIHLAVESLAERTVVGALSTANADRRAGRFSYGLGIGRAHQRRGYATDAAIVLLRFMFAERRYHKCEVGIYAFNEASIELHRKLGFQTEGRLRDHEFLAGRHHDMVLMGLMVDEFTRRHSFPSV